MKLLKTHSLISTLLIVMFSCTTEIIDPNTSTINKEEFFPLLLDKESLFEVHDIQYTILGSDTSIYFIKEKITSIADSNETKKASITISTSEQKDGLYEGNSVYTLSIKSNHLIQNIDNKYILKAIFPLTKNQLFDQNLYNLEDKKEAKITLINETFSSSNYLETYSFPNALNIEYENKINLIDNIYKHQVYQKDLGLVYDMNQEINTQPNQKPIGYKIIKKRIF